MGTVKDFRINYKPSFLLVDPITGESDKEPKYTNPRIDMDGKTVFEREGKLYSLRTRMSYDLSKKDEIYDEVRKEVLIAIRQYMERVSELATKWVLVPEKKKEEGNPVTQVEIEIKDLNPDGK